jgi:hypothetical protein
MVGMADKICVLVVDICIGPCCRWCALSSFLALHLALNYRLLYGPLVQSDISSPQTVKFTKDVNLWSGGIATILLYDFLCLLAQQCCVPGIIR